MTDRERILTSVVYACQSEIRYGRTSKEPIISFPFREPEPGELAIAMTSCGHNEFGIGFYVSKIEGGLGGALIREIGTNRICTYSNEAFIPVVGLPYETLLDGERREFHVKLLKAMIKSGHEYIHRPCGLRLDGDIATITVRQRWSDKRYRFSIPWNKKMTIKAIAAAIGDQGYGDDSKFKEATQ